MKKSHSLIFILLCTVISIFAQVPEAFNYQAVVRNSSGEIITNTNIAFRISILQGSETGTPVYLETHSVNTNNFGLVNLQIGKGTVVSGVFIPGDWGAASHFIKVEFDKDGGTGYVHLGTSPLLSVPYAFHAQTVAEDAVDDADADATNEIQSLQLSGTQLSLSKNGGTVTLPYSGGGGDNWGTQTVTSNGSLSGQGTDTDPLKVENSGIEPEWANIANKPAGFADGEDDVTDNDADPENELQTLSISGNDLSISDGNTVSLSEASSPWLTSGSNIYFNTGNIGIGVSNPAFPLQVNGTGVFEYSGNYLKIVPNNNAVDFWFGDGSGEIRSAVFKGFETNFLGNMNVENGNLLVETSNLSNSLQVNGDGLLFSGEGGSIPATGTGTRMMWYPKKSAFRAGWSNGNLWDDDKVGSYSVAMGLGTEASGPLGSTAFGEDTRASGTNAFAVGMGTHATGERSTAMGNSTIASGVNSTALGVDTRAIGDRSLAAGDDTRADAYVSTVFGRYNVGGGSSSSWNDDDPLFEIGNGTTSNKSNALTVLKNGNTGIGASSPAHNLVIYDTDDIAQLSFQNTSTGNSAYDGFLIGMGNPSSANACYVWNYENGGLGFGANNELRMQINANGNTVIGDVMAAPEGEELLNIVGANPRILIEATSSNPEINFKNAGDISTSIWAVYKDGGTGNLNFYQNGNKLTLQKNTGNVGIGTTNPQGKLDVNGNIYQRGGELHADYVFSETYKLESIEEHAEYMWKNKHLPAIPKATTDENGFEVIEVGSHRKGIVEELEKAHIYISQLEKKLQQQSEIINELKINGGNRELVKRIEKLEKLILKMEVE